MRSNNSVKIAYIGGGSYGWTPGIVRDIIFKEGMEDVQIDLQLLDIDLERAELLRAVLQKLMDDYKIGRVKITATTDAHSAIDGADFVIITISTGGLATMKYDLAIPEKYGIYHTVGDTCGPGGWSRSLRNIPVFKNYAKLIKELAPDAYVLNYTNPMGVLTKALADELGSSRVVGLCHGLFECYRVLRGVFGLESDEEIQVRFGGMNHFFFITDLRINGEDGYRLLREKLGDKNFAALIKEIHADEMGFKSDKWLTGELFANYGYLPYVGDRHTCEFFGCYITDKQMMERFRLVRTTIEDRQQGYDRARQRLHNILSGTEEYPGGNKPSRETAADMIKAITFNHGFTDVVNTINRGQIPNLPMGAVVETMGYVDSAGFVPITTGPLPEQIKALMIPHAEVQMKTCEAGISGDLEGAMLALLQDPVCSKLTASDIRQMGMELLEANKHYLPQFYK